MINDAKYLFLLLLCIGSCNVVEGQDKHSSEGGSDFGLLSMLILVLFCMCGTFFCLYFTCCHEYMCETNGNARCGFYRPTEEDLKSNCYEDGDTYDHQETRRSQRS